MKETSFINQNKDKWRKFENAYKANTHNPDELSNLFVEITEDLSYARTHYPKRTVRVYLNNLAQDVFTSLYRIKNRPFKKFITFWTKSLPLEAFRMRKDMLIALVIFVIGSLIGVVSTSNDINYARVILSDGYVEMTDRHIKEWLQEQESSNAETRNKSSSTLAYQATYSGSPLKVYADSDAWPMFSQIFFHNLQISFFMFVTGLIFGLGTLFYLMYNSIMVGTFQSYFYYKGLALGKTGLLYSTFLTIWIHGAFEITAMVLAAACGFALGRSLMFPKTMTRLQSLQGATKRAVKVFIGVAVFDFFAAILESWVTRQYNMPEWGKLMIIIGSFLIMFLVFVFIPFLVARRYPNEVAIEENPSYNGNLLFNLYSIRGINELVTDTFILYRRLYKHTIKALYSFILPLSFIFLYFLVNHYFYYYNDSLVFYTNVSLLFGVDPFVWIVSVLFWPIISGIFLSHVFYYLQKNEDSEFENPSYFKFMLIKSPQLTLAFFPISLLFQFSPGWLMIISTFILPFYLPVLFAIAHGKNNLFKGIGKGFAAGANSYGNGLAIHISLLLLSFVFLGLLTAQIYYITEELLRWHLETRFENYLLIIQTIRSCFFIFFYFHMLKLFTISFSLIYYHVQEAETSKALYSKLATFGKTNKYYETLSED